MAVTLPIANPKKGVSVPVRRIVITGKKAASMGTIESVHEGTGSDGEYEVTIKVRT